MTKAKDHPRVERVPPACAVAATVVVNRRICREHIALELELPSLPASRPGQFLQIVCPESGEAQAGHQTQSTNHRSVFLRRPFSIADRRKTREGHVRLTIISRAVGPGTRRLERMRAGETLDITGPLGRGFEIPDSSEPIVLVGGGVGIPPLLYLSRELHDRGWADISLVLGARSLELLPVALHHEPASDGTPLPCAALPGESNYPTAITTDDGSGGLHGTVADALRIWCAARTDDPLPPLVCACGPSRMLRAVAEIATDRGLGCQLCIERTMACGVGTCLSCIVRVRDDQRPTGERWALACQEGPVFDAGRLLEV